MVSGRFILSTAICSAVLLFCCCADATSQDSATEAAAKQSSAENDPTTEEQTEFAPGVLTVVPPAPKPDETTDGPLALQTFLDGHPEIIWGGESHPDGMPHFDPRSRMLAEMAEEVFLRREIYCLEFSFKPLRQILTDVPRPDGRMQRKLVWYMVFRIRYRGGDLRPAADEVGGKDVYERIESVSYQSRRVFPMLVLNNRISGNRYTDRILPTVKQKIAIREQITAPLYNTVEISRVEIPKSSDTAAPGVWGVATWEDVDPDLDFFSVDVFGLTNAFEQDGEGADAPYRKKALQLNFFRPGDKIQQIKDTIRFGVPAYENKKEQDYVLQQYGIEKRLDYRWIFR
ncbi:hypothetical protein [Novipirellula artificiosorum]|uniref:Secreted protein n=1 Tax=Novipirellula artificiosorum TaxID=2528016 RepID=A0A5C6DBY5_9BACT|nr:hypothetical protein [Novipirellula artificiosorum]TWU33715.1 hypothetical protein Poly41_47110 [Novipirellula artificiosorum]